MKVARFDNDWNFMCMWPEDRPAPHTEQVGDEQYALLESGQARWVPGKGLVLSDADVRCAALRFMKRDYHARHGAAPIRNKVHDCATDQKRDPGQILVHLMMALDLRDGDEFEVCVTPTGRRPQGDRWFLFPYERPETDDEVLKRIQTLDTVGTIGHDVDVSMVARVELGRENENGNKG